MNARCAGVAALLCLAAAGSGCGERAPAPGEAMPARVDTAAPTAPAPPALETVAAETAQARTGPDGQPFEVALRTPERAAHLQRRIGMATFDVALRTTGLTQYPCTSCHTPGVVPARSPQRIADAHQNVQPVHPSATAAACASCHAVDDMAHLVLQTGERVTLDQAYRLCAQCHFRQADAWAGGAHGKRLDGWHGRRVVMGCADCHDPHQPAVGRRIPFPGPRFPPTARRER